MIIGLDLGTRLGVCYTIRILKDRASYSMPKTYDLRGLEHGARFSELERILNSLAHESLRAPAEKLEALYYERVHRHNGTDAAHLYGGYVAIVKLWGFKQGVPVYGIPVQDIKSFATGHANAEKIDMIRAAKRDGVVDIDDDNAADAYWVCKLAATRGAQYHGGTKTAQRHAAEKELERRATGGTRKAKI